MSKFHHPIMEPTRLVTPRLRLELQPSQEICLTPNLQSGDTKLCIIIDSRTPIIMRAPIPPGQLTLGQFKAIALLQDEGYKFYFKSHDPELGTVKEEILDDNSTLPVDGDRVVAWVLSSNTNQSALFETEVSTIDQGRVHRRSPSLIVPPPTPVPSTPSSGMQSEFSQIYVANPNEHSDPIYFEVQMNLSNQNFLGLTLVGPSDETGSIDRGIFVGKISPNSLVEQDGRIQVGDRIVEINGIDLRYMRNDDAVATFKSCVEQRGSVYLYLQRDRRRNSPVSFASPHDYNYNTNQDNDRTTNGPKVHLPSNLNSPKIPLDLPIPEFPCQSRTAKSARAPIPPRRNYDNRRPASSLPRSVTPRSLYAINNFESPLNPTSPLSRLHPDSRSVYEPTTPTSLRQFHIPLHCTKDSIETIYAALRSDTKSLDIKDRDWLKVIIPNAFLGSALVKWLSRNVYGFSHKREIKQYANKMLNVGLIRNPMSSGAFSEKCYYTLS